MTLTRNRVAFLSTLFSCNLLRIQVCPDETGECRYLIVLNARSKEHSRISLAKDLSDRFIFSSRVQFLVLEEDLGFGYCDMENRYCPVFQGDSYVIEF